jgi:hypothetical protein
MTPAERLRAQAAELLALADEIEGEAPAPSPRGTWIDSHIAERIIGQSRSTIYRLAREGEITGEQTPKGQWRYLRSSVEAYARRMRL